MTQHLLSTSFWSFLLCCAVYAPVTLTLRGAATMSSWGMRATPARKARDEKRRDELQSQIQEDKLVEFQMMCDDGEADGCFNLAEWHAVVNKDHAKAAQMYLHNCLTMSHGPSCHHAALMYSAFTRRAMVCQQYAHAELFAPCPLCSASVVV